MEEELYALASIEADGAAVIKAERERKIKEWNIVIVEHVPVC